MVTDSERVGGQDMDQIRMPISTGDGGYVVGFRKAQLEPLLATLLQDPLLSDVSKKRPSVKELETLIGVEKGSAMMLCIRKMDGTTLDVAVLNTASVRDFKAAIVKKVDEMEEENMGHRHISWKHVWGNFCLVCNNNDKLLNDSSLLSEFGIKNGDELSYAHHLASREAGCHSHPKKRRFFHGLQKTASFK
ncbi:unnamed protein product [Calypogeia fissa]